MKKIQFAFLRGVYFAECSPKRRLARGCLWSFLCVLLFGSATVSFAQAPGWSRGIQLMNMNMEECKRRARGALEASGYRVDGQGGDWAEDHYFAGTRDRHSAAIACDMTSNNYMWINVFVASTEGRDAAGVERTKLQAQMERPGSGQRPGSCSAPDFFNTTFEWIDGDRRLGTINFYRDGSTRVTWINVPHTWRTDNNGDLMISGGGTRWVIRLKYDPSTCTFRGTRDRTSQTQDGVQTIVRPSGR